MHTVTWEKEGVYLKISNTLSFEEVLEIINELFGDARFDNIRYVIWDELELKESLILKHHSDEFAAIGSSTRSYKPNMKVAFVSKNDNTIMLIEQYIMTSLKMGSTWKFSLHETLERALSWVS